MIGRCWTVLLMFSLTLHSQITLTEIMFDPAGSERSDEFIELYNHSENAINLNGWEIGDSSAFDEIVAVAGQGIILNPGQFAVLLDSDYFSLSSATYDSIIPPAALLLTIDGVTFGNGGLSNSRAKTILLVTADKDTLAGYKYSLGNTPGYSDEKIDLAAGNDNSNWGNSNRLHGTPGMENSLTPKSSDLAIGAIEINTNGNIAGNPIEYLLTIRNLGQLTTDAISIIEINDRNSNGLIDDGEILRESLLEASLPPGDSLQITGSFLDISYGRHQLGLGIQLAADEDLSNNFSFFSIFVDDPDEKKLFINEIMANPLTGFEEWIEIYNAGVDSIDLGELFFADSQDTIPISDTTKFIAPAKYVVFGGDDILRDQYNLSEGDVIVNSKFPALNNGFDEVRLLGPGFALYDYVAYTDDWYGIPAERGLSLEKINPSFNSQMLENWTASVANAGSTPAEINSVFLEIRQSEKQLEIFPNPFSPDNDGFEDFTAIQIIQESDVAYMNVRIYDLRGRLIRFLRNGERVAASSSILWDGKDDWGRTARIGAYICHVEILGENRSLNGELKKTIILIKK